MYNVKTLAALVVVAVAASSVSLAEAYSEFSAYTNIRQDVAYQMVDNAIAAFEMDMNTAFADIQNPDNALYNDVELYVFVLDSDGTIVAHGASPDLVGTDTHDLTDGRGANVGDLFDAHLSAEGAWIEYYWPNPATETDEPERKLAWTRVYQGYVFSVGIYPEYTDATQVYLDDASSQQRRLAQAMVEQALQAIIADKYGAFAAIQDRNNPLYHDGELYVFVNDIDGEIVAHGITPDILGQNANNLVDRYGTNIGELYNKHGSPYGAWVQYYWGNPATETDETERKLTWFVQSAGYTIGVGIYPDSPGAPRSPIISEYDRERQEVAWNMVMDAVDALGMDMHRTMQAIQDPEDTLYHDEEIYLTVLDQDGVIMAHGVSPDLVGVDAHDITDMQGTNLGELFDANRSPYGKWVEYYWPNPITDTDEPEFKMLLLVPAGNYLVAAGIYPHMLEP
ncbi:MAG: hypothetical protein F4245_01045 [Cenarchaeum sp. SB0678_bin_8]|nr:hypothetical protein [Cenarchaeum sp. SB0678_bin_8]